MGSQTHEGAASTVKHNAAWPREKQACVDQQDTGLHHDPAKGCEAGIPTLVELASTDQDAMTRSPVEAEYARGDGAGTSNPVTRREPTFQKTRIQGNFAPPASACFGRHSRYPVLRNLPWMPNPGHSLNGKNNKKHNVQLLALYQVYREYREYREYRKYR